MTGKEINFTLLNNRQLIEVNFLKMPKNLWKDFRIKRNLYLDNLLNKNSINDFEYKIVKGSLNQWFKDMRHPIAQVKIFDSKTKTYTYLNYIITRQPSDVWVVPSLVESYYGISVKNYKVIKVTDSLYITSHSIITELQVDDEGFLKMLKYNEKKGFYEYADVNIEENSLTTNNINLIIETIKKDLLKSDTITQVDITSNFYIKDSMLAYKLLKIGSFNKNEYEFNNEVEKVENELEFKAWELKENAIILVNNKEEL